MTKDLLIILFAAPLAAVVLSFAIQSSRVAEYATVIAAAIDLVVSIPLLVHVLHGPVVLAHSYVQLDLLGAWVILCISIVYTLSSIYAVGYMRLLNEEERLPLFYSLFCGFAFTMLAACVVNNVGVFWIAIELTTLISTFLVGFEREAQKQRGNTLLLFQSASALLCWVQCFSIGVARLFLGQAMR
jgi:hydrogenase-4 component F